MILNVHERRLALTPAEAGSLIETLASPDDRLWPHGRWPAMRFDRPLGVGANGGHGFVRYRVSEHLPGERVTFRFDPRIGIVGTHALEVVPARDGGSTLRHVLEGHARGRMRLLWPLAVRWLHDALVEDALDRAEAASGAVRAPRRWSPWVRLLRRLFAARGRQSAPVGGSAALEP